jgi:hypothetical protein
MKNEETGGGDIHRYSMQPLFRGSIVVCRLPQRPGKASEQKESMTVWWYAVIRNMKRGDNCNHHGDGPSVWCQGTEGRLCSCTRLERTPFS